MGWDKEENYAKKKDLEEYTKKNTFNKKVSEIEATLGTKLTKQDLPDISNLAKKEDIPDLNNYVTKEELPKPIDLSDYAKKEHIPEIPDHSIYLEKKHLEPYARKEDIPKDYITKKDISNFVTRDQIPDTSEFAKKSDLKQYEIFHCFVKLNDNFMIYDGSDWAFEFVMGNRGNWQILTDTHNCLSKPGNYVCYTPFEGVFHIDFCFTCQKDTHILKPHVLQRIRTKHREVVNFEYYDNNTSKTNGHDQFSRSFIKTCQLYLPKDDEIKFSMEFTNRLHNHKKQWLHAKGSHGGFTPTYFSVTGYRSK